MKLISDDRAFIYYATERPDGKTEGVRIGRTFGAMGFITATPLAELKHPVTSTSLESINFPLPVESANDLSPIILDVLGSIEEVHPEINDLLTGRISFDDALAS